MSDDPNARDPVGEDARIDALEERLKAATEREEKRASRRRVWKPMRTIASATASWPN
jgi:hypothetical protein